MAKGDRAIGKADPEDGTTPIANLLLEALITTKLTNKERVAILFLIRRTYGWVINGSRLKSDVISLNTWAKILQVKDNTRASHILADLVEKGVFNRESLGPGKSYIYTLNTTVANWNNGINQQQLAEIATLVLPKYTRVVLYKNATPTATDLASPKEKIKEMLNKDIDSDIDNDASNMTDQINQVERELENPNLQSWQRKQLEQRLKELKRQDPNKFIRGKYGHMVRR